MKPLCWLAVLLPLLVSFPAAAQFYKYVDKNGSIRFTDDITMVPPDQRSKLKVYEESKPAAPEAATRTGQPPAEAAPEQSASPPANDVDEERLRSMKEALDRKKAELADEYRALKEERAALESRRGEFRTKAEVKQYEEAIRRLNEKNAAYERKRKSFEEEVEAYNRLNAQFAESARIVSPSPSQAAP